MTTTTTLPPQIQRVDKLYLELLFRCNFSCAHCYHGEDLARPEVVSLEQAKGLFDYFADGYGCKRVCLLGGEPLLHPTLPELLAAAKSSGYQTEICTNGYKRRAVLERCLPHLDMLRISLDGGTAETHDAIRRKGSFAAAFDTIAWAAERGLDIGATCTLTGENIHTVPELASRLRSLGVTELMLHRVRAIGNAADSGITEVTWEQTQWLHGELTKPGAPNLRMNTDILLPERCAPPTDVIEKLEVAPDGRIYFSCAEVAGTGRSIKFDFDRGVIVSTADPAPMSITGA